MVKWIDELKKDIVRFAIVVETMDERDEADIETIKVRENACKSCEYNKEKKCQICECYIELKVRSKVNRTKIGKKEITHCPKGKWDDKLILTYIKNF